MAGILQVLPPKKSKNNVLKCHKKKDAQRENESLSKNAKCPSKTQEECAKNKKTMCECVKRQRQTETEKQGAKCKKTNRDCKTRQQQTETDKQGAKRKKTDCDCKTRKQQTEMEEQAAKQKKTKRDCMRRKCEEMRH